MKVISMSPARSVNFTARSSSNVHPLPPQPVVMASFHTAATLSRSKESETCIRSGKSWAISFVVYFMVCVMSGAKASLARRIILVARDAVERDIAQLAPLDDVPAHRALVTHADLAHHRARSRID